MKKDEVKKIRTFSVDIKKGMVKKYEEGKISVLEISKLYEVSLAAVYKWIKKYSRLPPTEKYVVEHKSEGKKQMVLLRRIKDLEQLIGKQQMELFYLEKVVDYGSEIIGGGLKKKANTK